MQNEPAETYLLTEDTLNDAVYDCLHSKYIRENDEYASKAKKVIPLVDMQLMGMNGDTVNAFSCRFEDFDKFILSLIYPTIDWQKYDYCICTFHGMLSWLSMLGYIGEYFCRTRNVTRTRKMLEWIGNNETKGKVGSDVADRFVKEFGKYLANGDDYDVVKGYAINSLRSVIAHEAGHIMLGHCSGISFWDKSLSRNDERCADMFASTLMQSMITGVPGVVATTLVDISFTWMGKHGKRSQHPADCDDHPASKERVRNFIESFNAMLEGSDITGNLLMKLCRE